MRVTEMDAIAPAAILFGLNVSLLLAWTLGDPLQWVRRPLAGDDWSTYGTCTTGTVGKTMLGLITAVDVGALFLLCYQAYKARNISDALSESKYLGIAIFSWTEVVLVGLPVLFLLGDDNPSAKYFLRVVLIFVLCMSMLLLIFIPLAIQLRASKNGVKRRSSEIVAPGTTSCTRSGSFFNVSIPG